MGVTIQKQKPAGKQKSVKAALGGDTENTVVKQPVSQDTVDEFLALDAKLKKHAAKVAAEQKRFDELKTQIMALVDETTLAEQGVTLVGLAEKGTLEISERTMQTTLTDIDLAKKFMGKETFFQVAKIGVADLKDYLTPEQRAQCTKTERSGSRRMKIK